MLAIAATSFGVVSDLFCSRRIESGQSSFSKHSKISESNAVSAVVHAKRECQSAKGRAMATMGSVWPQYCPLASQSWVPPRKVVWANVQRFVHTCTPNPMLVMEWSTGSCGNLCKNYQTFEYTDGTRGFNRVVTELPRHLSVPVVPSCSGRFPRGS